MKLSSGLFCDTYLFCSLLRYTVSLTLSEFDDVTTDKCRLQPIERRKKKKIEKNIILSQFTLKGI
jgi:hypothetical protein